MKILDVRIDNFSEKEILEKIEFFLDEPRIHHVATVNPEFILKAQKDLAFKSILNNSDLNVADGVGIWYAFLRNFAYLENRMAGIDLMEEILKIANEKKETIFLAIHKNGLSLFEEIKDVLNKKYPNVIVEGMNIDPRKNKKVLAHVDHSIVFCNFGFPEQEKFINLLKKKHNSDLRLSGYQGKIRLAMGVGGSFDFITEKIRRAPRWMQKVGLEWLWRFALEPRYRIKRIFNAVIVFPIKVLFDR